jgi:hypothetical protein
MSHTDGNNFEITVQVKAINLQPAKMINVYNPLNFSEAYICLEYRTIFVSLYTFLLPWTTATIS